VADTLSPEFLALQQVVAGRYSLERELGRGGMAVVFLARDVALDRPVAIKLMPPFLAGQPPLRERFLREARTAAQLSHPNIVPIHAVEEQGGISYFVMGFVDGETVGQRVRRAGPLTPAAVVRLVQEVAWALAYAHSRGVVHRDIKPDNILLDKGSGRAMVTDFGIARVADQSGGTSQGELIGTAHYMSPEQASGEAVDGRSDLYSLGVTAYYALIGRLPFDAPNLPAVILKHVTEAPPKVGQMRDGVPPRLAEAVDRCLAKQPADRFPTGEELAEAVGAAQVAVREVPAPLRFMVRWAQQIDVTLAIAGFVAYIFPELSSALWPKDSGALITVVVFPLVLITATFWYLVQGAREAIKAGLGWQDLKAAVQGERHAHREEVALLGTDSPDEIRMAQKRGRWRRRGWVAFGVGTLAIVVHVALVRPVNDPLMAVASTLYGVGMLAMLMGLRGLRLSKMARLVADFSGVGLWLMERAFGRWIFRLAQRGDLTVAANAPPATDRTEVLVGKAVSDLLADLPADLRHRLPDVLGLVQQMERDAGRLREREEVLSRAIAESSPVNARGGAPRLLLMVAELEAGRGTVRARLKDTVAALENIRIDLVRLRSGLVTTDQLTENLKRVQELGAAVDAELSAQREVKRLLGS
jgi:serine/threonine-protein kinase